MSRTTAGAGRYVHVLSTTTPPPSGWMRAPAWMAYWRVCDHCNGSGLRSVGIEGVTRCGRCLGLGLLKADDL